MIVTALIMAGGRGERFWPKSRRRLPKQFLSLVDDRTMLQLTVERILPLVPIERIFIATGRDYKELVREQLPAIPERNILCEPMGKNTAPCIGFGAVHIEKQFGDALMLVLSSDHMIRHEELFLDSLQTACQVAEKGENLVTLGIRPDYPETGYGYIKFCQSSGSSMTIDTSDGYVKGLTKQSGKGDEKVKEIPESLAWPVECFVEKPDMELAKKYVISGKYLWNSGMFVWKISSILENMKKFMPETYKGLKTIQEALGTEREEEVLEESFRAFSSESIDYGVMEKAEHIYTVPGDFGWDDVGSWMAVGRMKKTDKHRNVIEGNILAIDSEDCIFQGEKKLIAAVGLKDLVIVDTADAILICSKNDSGKIKSVLEQLRQKNQQEYL